ncbi:SurA N-terminal domain-containing protein [Neptunicella marina]|uniref:Periplasmic chaperone PpiD n=1 Tax=Neptunicella marina TaxID=2125989 RepID=A0A8J6IV74_9ALTE|nr:SurA N-terminal domain-containing protein [Neptunicella marina]MBC3766440.1 SurA N-terminal domain-containing protein [Neptunicella marina]
MLEKIREGSQGFWAKAILGFVCITFALAGVGSYLNTKAEQPVATVNGTDIGAATFERAYQNERARLESQYGDAFADLASDSGYLKQIKQSVLDRLIAETLFEQTAEKLGLRVSDEQIKQKIVNMREFQLDGKFNNDTYLAILRQAGYQPSSFRDYMRVDMTRQQVVQALLGSNFALPSEAEQVLKLQQQTRDIRYLLVEGKSFADEVSVSDEEVNQYYQSHVTQYDTQEKVSLDYVELKIDDLLDSIDVSDDEVNQYYQDNLTAYQTEGERKVAHILIDFGDDEAAAKTKAEDILNQIKQGADFATLAQENSADIASAEDGGELAWFKKGEMDPAFEDAAFAMNEKGQLSDVVKSSFGFHIIKLIDSKKQVTTPLADIRDDVVAKVKHDKAVTELYSLQQRMAEVAFEVPDNLDEVASVAGKKIQTTELFDRNAAPELFNQPAVLNAVFTDEIIYQGVNSEVQEVGDNHVVVFRMHEHQPVRTRSLEEVSVQITETLKAEKEQQAALTWTQELVAALQNGEDITAKLGEKSVEWQEQKALPRYGSQIAPAISQQAFKMSAKTGENLAAVEVSGNNAALVEVQAINSAAETPADQIAGISQRLESMKSQQAMGAFVEALKNQAEIEVFSTL